MDKQKSDKKIRNSDTEFPSTTNSNLPGLDGIKVIISHPIILKENSSKPVKWEDRKK